MGCDMSSLSIPIIESGTDQSISNNGGRVPINNVVHNLAERRQQVRINRAKFQNDEQNLKRMAIGAFKDIQKRRIMAEVINTFKNPSGAPFVLVCDTLGTHLLSTQLDMSEIMYPEGPVCMVEKLGVVRQPMPDMEAVYFVEPCVESLRHIVADFAKKDSKGKARADWVKGDELFIKGQIGARSPDAQYKGFHILFTGQVSEQQTDLLKKFPELLRHMITFRESRLFFFPLENQVINFGMTNSLNRVYGADKGQGNDPSSMKLYDDVADKLLGVCVSLHETPVIRSFQKNPRAEPIVAAFCKKMKKHLDANLSGSAEGDTWWYHTLPRSASNGGVEEMTERAQLLLFDRAEDLSTPLLHEFTYQAMAMDLLGEDIVEGIGQTSFEYKIQEGKNNETSMFFNNSKDEIWRVNRHKHIADLATALGAWEKKFCQREDYQLMMKHKSGKLSRPKDQLKLMRSADDTTKTLEQYKRHTRVAKKLITAGLKKYDDDDEPLMFTISEVEGQIATGIDGNNKRAINDDKVRSNLMKLLERPEVGMEQKKRLLTLWFIHFGYKYSTDSHNKIFKSCFPELSQAEKQAIGNLTYLYIPINDHKRDKQEKKKKMVERTAAQKRAKELQDKNPQNTRKHEPRLVHLVARHIEKSLPQSEYPWRDCLIGGSSSAEDDIPPEMRISQQPEWYTSKTKAKPNLSLRGRAKGRLGGLSGNMSTSVFANQNSFNLDGVSESKQSGGDVREPGFKFTGSRIIVCVFGGVTYSELRGLYDLMQTTHREIIICATDILTPSHFLNQLRNMAPSNNDSTQDDDDDDDDDAGRTAAHDIDLDIEGL
jgi:syntaxin-binding protein 1